jgi:hypothetical protein
MHNWFETTIKFQKTCEDGQIRNVSELYFVDARSFTEAEKRIIEEITPFVSGELTVVRVKRARIAELFDNPNGDKWYRAKVNFISLDEEKGVEKKTVTSMMVQASYLKEALELLVEKLSNTLSDWEVAVIAETAIMNVYPYDGSTEDVKEE